MPQNIKRYQNLSEEQKGNKQQQKPQQYGCEGYKNLSEDGKQRLVEYITIYMKKWKNVSRWSEDVTFAV